MLMNHVDKFRLRTETKEGRCTVYISGELDLEAASHMRAVMEPLVGLCDRILTLNLRDLRYIDSTGIGILISLLKARKAYNACLAVEAIPANIRKLFDMTGITPFLNEPGPSQAPTY